MFLIITPGLKQGIDFTGGSTLTLAFSNPVTQQQLRDELALQGYPEASVQSFGENTFFMRSRELSDGDRDAIVKALEARLSPDGVNVLSFDLVSPVIARDTVLNGIYAVIAATVERLDNKDG